MSNKPIFFYSRNNRNCVQLWNKLNKENKLNNFIKICVDNNNKIPKIVTTVPSFFIRGRPLIHGNAISLFLNSNNQSVRNNVNSNTNVVTNINNPPNNVAPPANSSTNGLEGINDFNPIEMSNKWSDAYSFIQNNPTPMEFTYQFIQKEGNSDNISNNQNNNLRKKGSQLDQRLEKLQRERSQLNNNMMQRK
tara:strand:+ start:9443 stop:10018 length:576 start_codon:yes stop_codon:yes gene_type:complete